MSASLAAAAGASGMPPATAGAAGMAAGAGIIAGAATVLPRDSLIEISSVSNSSSVRLLSSRMAVSPFTNFVYSENVLLLEEEAMAFLHPVRYVVTNH